MPALDSEDGTSFVEVEADATLSGLRKWLRTLSIRRVCGESATPAAEDFLECAEDGRGGGGGGGGRSAGGRGCVLKRLPPDREVVDALDSALPEEHRGTLTQEATPHSSDASSSCLEAAPCSGGTGAVVAATLLLRPVAMRQLPGSDPLPCSLFPREARDRLSNR